MSYVKRDLIQGEKLIYETGLHWSVLIWPVIIAAIVGATILMNKAKSGANKVKVL